MADTSYLNYQAFAQREGRVVDISSLSSGMDKFSSMLNDMGRDAWIDTRRVVDFYESDEYLQLVDDVYDDITGIYEEIFTLDLYMPELLEEFYDPTEDMVYGLMYLDEMYKAKEDQVIAGFDFDYGAVEDIKDTIDYKEIHAGRSTPDHEGGFYTSPTGGLSISDYLMLQDVYTAYCKKINSGEDVTEIKTSL